MKYGYKKLKCEIGNIPTDWSPALEDTQSLIDNTNNRIDNLSVGGRNILRGTKDMKLGSGKWADGTWRKSGKGTIKNVTLTDFPLADIKQGVEITSSNERCGVCQDYISLESGHYTLSYYAKANTAGTQVWIHSFWNSEYSGKREYFTLNDTNWNRISVTGNLSVDQKTISAAYFYVETPNTIVTVAAPFEHHSEMIGDWSPAPEDYDLNSNPINSVLTTLSSENPSATLGGTWKQLGTESKFGQTVYYWQRVG